MTEEETLAPAPRRRSRSRGNTRAMPVEATRVEPESAIETENAEATTLAAAAPPPEGPPAPANSEPESAPPPRLGVFRPRGAAVLPTAPPSPPPVTTRPPETPIAQEFSVSPPAASSALTVEPMAPGPEEAPEPPARQRSRNRRRSRSEPEAAMESAETAQTRTANGAVAPDVATSPEPEAELKDESVQESNAPISTPLAEPAEVQPPPEQPTQLDLTAQEANDVTGVVPIAADAAPPTEEPSTPARGRRRAAAAAFPVEINVNIPRGLGKRIDSKLIQRAAQGALQRDGWQRTAILDVHVVTDEEMREVNATRRGIDEVTDVLSFPLMEVQPGGVAHDFFVLPPETPEHLGEVVISYERVENQADEAGHSREREWAFLTVHAVLHILGYDHDTDEKRRIMRRREEEILAELGLRRNGTPPVVAPQSS